MNNRICILVASVIFIGCDSTYFLKVDDCYVQKMNYEYGVVYTSLQELMLFPDFNLIIDDIQGNLKIDKDNIYLYMNEEKQMLNWHKEGEGKSTLQEPALEVYTEQGENRDTLIYANEFIKLKFHLDYTLPFRGVAQPPESFSIKVHLTDMEQCLAESECDPKNFKYSFTYFIEDDEQKVRRTDRGTTGWWRNPNVEVCVVD